MATAEDRLKQLKEETERRRRKFEEQEKAQREAEQLKAKEILERRKIDRLADDERMRKPWQQPQPPKKSILRAGQRKQSVSPAPRDASPSSDQKRNDKERARKEWREGLKAHIHEQRATAATPAVQPSGGDDGVEALTWAQLKLAAEAGFEELLRQQQMQEWMQQGDTDRKQRVHRLQTRLQPKATGPEPIKVKLIPEMISEDPYHHQGHQQQSQHHHHHHQSAVSAWDEATRSYTPAVQLPSQHNQGTTTSVAASATTLLDQAHGVQGIQGSSGGNTADTPWQQVAASIGAAAAAYEVEEAGIRQQGRREATTTAVRHRAGPMACSLDGAEAKELSRPQSAVIPPSQPANDSIGGAIEPTQHSEARDQHETAARDDRYSPDPETVQMSSPVGSFTSGHSSHLYAAAAQGVSAGSGSAAPAVLPINNQLASTATSVATYSDKADAGTSSDQGCAAGVVQEAVQDISATEAQGATAAHISQPQHLQSFASLTIRTSVPSDASTAPATDLAASPGQLSQTPRSGRAAGRTPGVITTCPASPSSPAARRAALLSNPLAESPSPAAQHCSPTAVTPSPPVVRHDPSPLSKQAGTTQPAANPQEPLLLNESEAGASGSINQEHAFDASRPAVAQQPVPAAYLSGSSQLLFPSTTSPRASAAALLPPHSPPGRPTADQSAHKASPVPPATAPAHPVGLTAGSQAAAASAASPSHVVRAVSQCPGDTQPATAHITTQAAPQQVVTSASQPSQYAAVPAAPSPALPAISQAHQALQGQLSGPAAGPHQVHQAAVGVPTQPPAASMPAQPPAVSTPAPMAQPDSQSAASDEFGALLAEIQHLSYLRKALRAEFEAMGHHQALAGLASLTATLEGSPVSPVQPVSAQPTVAGQAAGLEADGVSAAAGVVVSRDNAPVPAAAAAAQVHDPRQLQTACAIQPTAPSYQPYPSQPPSQVSPPAARPAQLPTSTQQPALSLQTSTPAQPAHVPPSLPTSDPLHQPFPVPHSHEPPLQHPVSAHQPVAALPAAAPPPAVQPHLPSAALVQPLPIAPPAYEPAAQHHQTPLPLDPAKQLSHPCLQAAGQPVLREHSNPLFNMDSIDSPVAQGLGTYHQQPMRTPAVPQATPHVAPHQHAPQQAVVQHLGGNNLGMHAGQQQPWVAAQPVEHTESGPVWSHHHQPATNIAHQAPAQVLGQVALQRSEHEAASHALIEDEPLDDATVPQPLQWIIPINNKPPGAHVPMPLLSPKPAQVNSHAAVSASPARPRAESARAARAVPQQVDGQGSAQHHKRAEQELSGYASIRAAVQQQMKQKKAVAASPSKTEPAVPLTERPVVLDGSYVKAAEEARARAQRDAERRLAVAEQAAAQRAAQIQQELAHQAALAALESQHSFNSSASHAVKAAAQQPNAKPLRAPTNIGSYAQPAPPAHVLNAQRMATAAAITAASKAKPAGGAATPASVPMSTAQTPASYHHHLGLPLSAPDTPGIETGSYQVQAKHHSQLSTASANPSTAHQQHMPSRSASATPSRIPAMPNVLAARATVQGAQRDVGSELEQVLAGMQDIDGALTELDDYLERASYDDSSPERMPAAGSLGASKKLQDLRPQQLQLPPSGMSTPATAGTYARAAQHSQDSRASRPAQVAAQQARVGSSRSAAPRVDGGHSAASSRTTTPFTAAIRGLIGLPGAAPLIAAQSPGQGRAAGYASGMSKVPEEHSTSLGLSAEEVQLLASLQRIDRRILQQALNNRVTPEPAPAGKGVRGASPGKPAGKAGQRPSRPANELAASQQALLLQDSIEKLDVKLAQLKERIQGNTPPASAAGTPVAAQPARQRPPTRLPLPSSAAAAGGGQLPHPASRNKTPTPNRAKALRDVRQAQMLAAAASHTASPVPSGNRQASAGARMVLAPQGVPPAALAPPRQTSAPTMSSRKGPLLPSLSQAVNHDQQQAGYAHHAAQGSLQAAQTRQVAWGEQQSGGDQPALDLTFAQPQQHPAPSPSFPVMHQGQHGVAGVGGTSQGPGLSQGLVYGGFQQHGFHQAAAGLHAEHQQHTLYPPGAHHSGHQNVHGSTVHHGGQPVAQGAVVLQANSNPTWFQAAPQTHSTLGLYSFHGSSPKAGNQGSQPAAQPNNAYYQQPPPYQHQQQPEHHYQLHQHHQGYPVQHTSVQHTQQQQQQQQSYQANVPQPQRAAPTYLGGHTIGQGGNTVQPSVYSQPSIAFSPGGPQHNTTAATPQQQQEHWNDGTSPARFHGQQHVSRPAGLPPVSGGSPYAHQGSEMMSAGGAAGYVPGFAVQASGMPYNQAHVAHIQGWSQGASPGQLQVRPGDQPRSQQVSGPQVLKVKSTLQAGGAGDGAAAAQQGGVITAYNMDVLLR